jgi:hypothetical protein
VKPLVGDTAEYAFLTSPGARVECCLVSSIEGQELQLLGNRVGLLSLANIFLWFIANSWRREFLSIGELAFVLLDRQLSLSIRLTDDRPLDSHGSINRQDKAEALEWAISEEGLQQIALRLHRLVSRPGHEYDRLLVVHGSACGVHIRMTDAAEWLAMGIV